MFYFVCLLFKRSSYLKEHKQKLNMQAKQQITFLCEQFLFNNITMNKTMYYNSIYNYIWKYTLKVFFFF